MAKDVHSDKPFMKALGPESPDVKWIFAKAVICAGLERPFGLQSWALLQTGSLDSKIEWIAQEEYDKIKRCKSPAAEKQQERSGEVGGTQNG